MVHKFKTSKEVIVMTTPKVSLTMELQIKQLGGLIVNLPIINPLKGVTITVVTHVGSIVLQSFIYGLCPNIHN